MATVSRKGNQTYGLVNLPDGKRKWLSFRDPVSGVRIEDQKQIVEMSQAWLRAYREASALPDADPRGKQAIVLHLCRQLCAALRIPEPGEKLGQGPDFTKFAKEWLARVEADIKPATVAIYSSAIRKFGEHLETTDSTTMGSVSAEDAQRYYDSMFSGQSLSTGTAKIRLGTLRGIFQHAVDFGLISKNPFNGVRARDKVTEERWPFSAEDESAILATVRGTEWETLCLISRWTGMRISDAHRVEWAWLQQLDGCTVLSFSPKKQRKSVGKGKEVKSVACYGPLGAHLAGLRRSGGFVLPKLSQRVLAGDGGLGVQFDEILQRAGVDRIQVEKKGRKQYRKGFHSWRHTFNTWLEKLGVDPATRAKITGHADTKTNQIYSHATAAELAKVVTKLDLP